MTGRVEIRRELRPGDLGKMVAHHGDAYAREQGLDSSFEGYVAAGIAEAAMRGWPAEREAVWLVERDGEMVGCIGLTDEGDAGMLRWFLLDPSVRGQGLGRRLVGEVIETARRLGFEKLQLETFSDLTVAAHLYRSHGFELVGESTEPRWGRDALTYQRYELELSPRTNPEHAEHPAGMAASSE